MDEVSADAPLVGRFDTAYFDTLTNEEWAAHDASYERAVEAVHAQWRRETKQP